MAEFKIGNYKIETQKVYEALNEAKATSEKVLKKIDSNGDKVISEDELVQLLDDNADSDTKTSGSKSKDSDTASSLAGNYDTTKELCMEQELSLQTKLNSLYSKLAKAKDTEAMNSILSQIKSTQSQMDSIMNSYYNILVQEENAQAQAEAMQQAYSSAYSSPVSSISSNGSSVSSPINVSSSSGSGGGSAAFALKYDGKGASEMQSIMQSNGCNFHSGAWCADFVTFATKMTYGNNTPHDFVNTCANTAYCPEIGNWAQQRGIYTTDLSKVKPGDFILYGSRGSERHIGIVTAVNSDGTVDTIEGNTSDDNGNYTNGVVNRHSHVKSWGGFVLMH